MCGNVGLGCWGDLVGGILHGQGLPVNLCLPGFVLCSLMLKLSLSSSSQAASVLGETLNIIT